MLATSHLEKEGCPSQRWPAFKVVHPIVRIICDVDVKLSALYSPFTVLWAQGCQPQSSCLIFGAPAKTQRSEAKKPHAYIQVTHKLQLPCHVSGDGHPLGLGICQTLIARLCMPLRMPWCRTCCPSPQLIPRDLGGIAHAHECSAGPLASETVCWEVLKSLPSRPCRLFAAICKQPLPADLCRELCNAPGACRGAAEGVWMAFLVQQEPHVGDPALHLQHAAGQPTGCCGSQQGTSRACSSPRPMSLTQSQGPEPELRPTQHWDALR